MRRRRASDVVAHLSVVPTDDRTESDGADSRASPAVTDLAVLRAQAAVIESLRSFKRETTSVFSHDLKSPLSAIMMNLDFATAELGDKPEHEAVVAALDDCRMAVLRAFRMLTDMLDVARSEDGRLAVYVATFEIGTLVEKVASARAEDARARHIAMTCALPPAASYIDGDLDLLERAMDNLVECALRLTRPGGRVHVFAQCGDGGTIALFVASDAPALRAEVRARLFSSPPQAGPQGVAGVWGHRGFGLYFARLVADAHGARLFVTEMPGFSTCFCIEFGQGTPSGDLVTLPTG